MRPLSSRELLAVWERGQFISAQSRARLLLGVAAPEIPDDELPQLTVGEWDRHLFRLRNWAFGSRLACLSNCPRCEVLVQFEEDIAHICRDDVSSGEGTFQLESGGYDIAFRLPTAGDLAAIEGCADAELAERLLLKRCTIRVQHDRRDVPLTEVSRSIALAIGERMAQGDPQADLGLLLECPVCALEWTAPFDIGSFFWSEVDAWAVRLMQAIHTLASAYGWREDDILELSPWRRQLYLEMVDR